VEVEVDPKRTGIAKHMPIVGFDRAKAINN